MKVALRVALGMVCFGIGAAGIIMAISVLIFGSVFQATVTGMLAALFLWFAYLLLRRCAGTTTNRYCAVFAGADFLASIANFSHSTVSFMPPAL